MTTKAIPEDKIPKLINILKRYEVFVPQKRRGEIVFAPVTDESRLVLNYQTTVLPPTSFFLPPEEELFTVKGKRVVETAPPKPFVIFGLSLKDLAGICRLDEIMSREPADSFYLNRRKKAILIAISDKEVPSSSPFAGLERASSLRSEVGIPPGGDLILEKIGKVYRAIALTNAGHKIANLPLFKERVIKAKSQPKGKPSKLEAMLLDSELLARAIEWSRENYPQIWERLGKVCLGCGICTYVCPLCYCFEMEDQTSLDKTTCTRCRYWSACTLPGFAIVAGGHNFRPTIKDRYYNWYYHKFVRAYKEFGQAQCVACGRCQKYCPAGIDIEKVLGEIVAEFQKAHPERKF